VKIVLTGGAGFIGMHLAGRLLRDGHRVIIVDSLHSYYPAERKKHHLEVINFPMKDFHKVDLLDREAIKTLMKEIRPDAVIHLAALPGVAYSIEEPLKYVDYDIKATINILEACGEAGTDRFLFASSSSVYGDKPGAALKEEDADGKTVSPYAASKWSAESFCHMYAGMYGLKLNIMRFFTVYGPWARPDMAIPKFIKKSMKGETISIFGADSGRDYTYIDDIVEGIHLTLLHGRNGEAYNLGSGREVKMLRLLEILQSSFPSMKLDFTDYRLGDVLSTHSDLSKAKNHLNYSPKTTIEEGLKKTIQWAENNEKFL
jgi:UDP-glucuronate 4-epimerase